MPPKTMSRVLPRSRCWRSDHPTRVSCRSTISNSFATPRASVLTNVLVARWSAQSLTLLVSAHPMMWLRRRPTVSVVSRSDELASRTAAAVASLVSGPSATPSASVKLTFTLSFLPTSAATGV